MYLHYNIGIATEQSFRYIELTDAKIWISKNVPLCRVLANRVTIKVDSGIRKLCTLIYSTMLSHNVIRVNNVYLK